MVLGSRGRSASRRAEDGDVEVAGAGIGVLASLHGRRGDHGEPLADDEARGREEGLAHRAAAEGDDLSLIHI